MPGPALLALTALAGCSSAMPDADRLELATIPNWKEVPKSSASSFVGAFRRYCVNRPGDMGAMDVLLRGDSYVPKVTATAKRPAIYVVDDRRPAVVVNDWICGVRARSRTGQTERVNAFVTETFPNARPVGTDQFSNDVEQVWQIDGGMIATQRNDWSGNRSAYTVTIFRPDS